MFQKNHLNLIIVLGIIFFLLPVLALSQSLRAPECCVLDHEITLDDISICVPVDCDPETTPGCCVRQTTWTFTEGQVVSAPTGEPGNVQCYVGVSLENIDVATPSWGMTCLVNTIFNITDWVFWLALSLSVIMGIITAFFFFTSGGEPSKVGKAKSMLTWVIVGTAVAVAARLIVALIISLVI